MEGLSDPPEAALRRRLRAAVVDHVAVERRRAFAPVLHVGHPGERVAQVPVDPAGGPDAALRVELVAAMRARLLADDPARGEPLVWLTRRGRLDPEDVDLHWLAAARAAYAEAEAALVFVVVTRHGWHDPRSGARQTWVRLRAPARRTPA